MVVEVPDGMSYQGYWKIVMMVILCVATLVILGLRLYSRFSTVPMLVFAALQILSLFKYGLRVHKKDLLKIFDNHHDYPDKYVDGYLAVWRVFIPVHDAIQIAWIQRLLYDFSSCLIKLSILVFLYTLSPYRSFHFFIYILMLFKVILALISIFMIIFQCSPIRATFVPPTHRPTGSRCFYGPFIPYLVLPVCSAMLDTLCWLIPMHLARRVKGRWKARVKVAMVLCMGLIAVIASVVKIVLSKWAIDSGDDSWYVLDIGCWTNVELSMAIICACSPALVPIFRLISRKIRYPDHAQQSGRRSATVHRGLENMHSGPSISLRIIGQSSTDVSSNHKNIPSLGIRTLQHQEHWRAYYASAEAFANAGSTGGDLSRESSVAPSLDPETVDANFNHECSTADVELGSGGGSGRQGAELDLEGNIA